MEATFKQPQHSQEDTGAEDQLFKVTAIPTVVSKHDYPGTIHGQGESGGGEAGGGDGGEGAGTA